MFNFTINYLIPLADENLENVSLFQGFSRGFLNSFNFLSKILNDLPINIEELNLKREEVIRMRVCGVSKYSIIPFDINIINQFPIQISSPFYCIFSDDMTILEIEKYLSNVKHPILHISTIKSDKAIFLEQANYKDILKYVDKVVDYLKDNFPSIVTSKHYKIIDNAKLWRKKYINFNQKNHLITIPNEVAVKSLNYQFKSYVPLLNITNNNDYIDVILGSAELVFEERSKALKANNNLLRFPPANTILLSLASMYRQRYREKLNPKNFNNSLDKKKLILSIKHLQKQKKYYFECHGKDVELLSSPEFQTIMAERTSEIKAFTYSIAVRTCNNFAPCLRLPPELNLLHGDIIQFSNTVRNNSSAQHQRTPLKKINNMFHKVSDRMYNIIDNKFIEFIKKFPHSIKLISDIPLEWLPIDDLPLILRFNCSRISSTPGNLCTQQLLNTTGILTCPDDFHDILIIRSFNENDPIKNYLEKAINKILKVKDANQNILKAYENHKDKRDKYEKILNTNQKDHALDMNIKFVDVHNEKDLIDALNSYNGNILIFDGHVTHDKNSDIGSILLRNTKYDIWNLRGKARIPPIVLLSACDTHPVDASHASTANGFLSAGAMTVLATVLPVDAIDSSIFIARFIFRLKLFLGLYIYEINKPIRWTNVVSGMMKMTYATECLNILTEIGVLKLNMDAILRIQFETNMNINSELPNWYELFLNLVSKESQNNLDEIKKLIGRYSAFTDILKYIQLGNPEQILILTKDFIDDYQKIYEN